MRCARCQGVLLLLVIGLLVLQLSVVPCFAQPPAPTPTPTAIPAVAFALADVISTSQQLATVQVDAWRVDAPTGPLFISLSVLALLGGMLALVKGIIVWGRSDD